MSARVVDSITVVLDEYARRTAGASMHKVVAAREQLVAMQAELDQAERDLHVALVDRDNAIAMVQRDGAEKARADNAEAELSRLRPVAEAARAIARFTETIAATDYIDEDDFNMRMAELQCTLFDAVRTLAATPCDHKWVDARNSIVLSGECCLKCGAMRAGNTSNDAQTESAT